MNTVPSITFLTDWYTILYFAVLLSQLTSVYSNAKKGKNRFAIASIVFILTLPIDKSRGFLSD
ncbi:hypothetical protein [Clostridium tetani]|uniref:hypothetical protein n=1 Tax=Clostridium tetani TaxID=1513 RepID=UPI00100AF5FA|nr:hypothetical protein [Clostridium tetani]RXI67783.1 hypothetical protein DP127_13980 [Clostridium tetani]RXM56735.1 hypothetical protein DP133_13525 [Clostridium tetani]BDR77017.1 hypothetical protein K154306013_p10680 [Clostridium tetani]BDR88149.1 hypothetical protein N071400001_p10840 [Clostridium tetani]